MSYGYAGYGRPTGFRERCELNHRDKKPVPPLAEYEAYQHTLDKRCRASFQPAKVRRIVSVLREGEKFGTACRMVGYRMAKARYLKMPEHLR